MIEADRRGRVRLPEPPLVLLQLLLDGPQHRGHPLFQEGRQTHHREVEALRDSPARPARLLGRLCIHVVHPHDAAAAARLLQSKLVRAEVAPLALAGPQRHEAAEEAGHEAGGQRAAPLQREPEAHGQETVPPALAAGPGQAGCQPLLQLGGHEPELLVAGARLQGYHYA